MSEPAKPAPVSPVVAVERELRRPIFPPGRVGVVGLGVMGGAIVRHLVGAGFSVAGYDVRAEAVERAEADGATACASIAELAELAPVVITSIPSKDALGAIARALGAAAGVVGVVIEASTLGIEDKESARDLLDQARIVLLDCPISGTGAQMRAGDAVTYASGHPEVLEQCMGVLGAYSRRVLLVGPFGNGSRLKLVANHLVAVHNVAAAEAVALAMRLGLDPHSALAALTEGAGTSRMLEVRGPIMVERSYQPATMRADLFEKDLTLIADLARRSGASTPLFDASAAVYRQALARGHGDDDTASVLEVLLAATDRRSAPQ